ncbi:MAG: hypothetical protein Q9219_007199 [cf. Caloplaca sp. 3 TL-2023]
MLFDDDRYAEKDSIVFDWSPLFWGMGPEKYCYSTPTLQQTILTQMEQSGWMGIIATRYNDIRNGTKTADHVIAKYKEAWDSRGGMISENGLFRRWYAVRQDRIFTSEQLAHSAWVMAFMPWNPSLVAQVSSTASTGFLQPIANRINIRPPALANEIRRLTLSSPTNTDPESPSLLARAHSAASHHPTPTLEPRSPPLPTFGFVAQWLSELSNPSKLTPLLRHADAYLNPTSTPLGGLYYARHDPGWDAEGNYLYMEPYSGNAAIGYARLNVQGGQRRMFEAPWTREEVRGRVCVEGVGLEDGVDFLRGRWVEVEGRGALVVTVKRWDGKDGGVVVGMRVKGLGVGVWGVYVDGGLRDIVRKKGDGDRDGGEEDVVVEVEVGGEEVDVVVMKI